MRTIFAPQEAELATHLDYKHKSAGTDLMTLAGGQFILPIEAVAGGMSSGIPPGAAAEMRVQLEEALPLACALFDRYREMPVAMQDRIGTWGDDASTHYIPTVEYRRPNYYGDQIRVMGADGAVLDSFPVRDYRDYLTEEDTDYMTAQATPATRATSWGPTAWRASIWLRRWAPQRPASSWPASRIALVSQPTPSCCSTWRGASSWSIRCSGPSRSRPALRR